MKIDIPALFTSIRGIVTDTKIMVKAILFIVSIAATYAITISTISKAKVIPCEDCGYYRKQNAEMLQALIQIKKDIQSVASSTTYIMDEQPLTVMYASYDTVKPKRKRQTQQQIKLNAIAIKLDSMIYKMQRQQKQ